MLSKYFPALENKISVIPNLIDIEKIILNSTEVVSDFVKQKGIVSFVTVTRFSKEKGIDLAIDVATELRNQGLKFKWYFIGEGETFSDIKKIVVERDLVDCCIFLGMKENPYPYIKLADFYIQTSLVESQSITIFEALVLKKIIITSNLPALVEALKDGKLGFLCEIKAADFVQRINWLLGNKVVQDRMNNLFLNHQISNDITYREMDKLF